MKAISRISAIVVLAASLFFALNVSAAESKPKPYPLKTCVVTGEKLGEMGDPYTFTYEGQEIKLCCKGCLSKFKKEPAKYLKKIEEARKGSK